ncbi:MAG: hypothetical protein HC821_03305, partial [Lewinella sp.]|nr:hypothetical protein [Lewinella sp.]
YQLRISSSLLPQCADSISITVLDRRIPPRLSLLIEPPSCQSNAILPGQLTIQAQGQPPYQYRLNDGPLGQDSVFTRLAPGAYSLSVLDANGCGRDSSFSLANPADFFLQLTPNGIVDLEFGSSLALTVQSNLPTAVLDSLRWLPSLVAPGTQQLTASAELGLFYRVEAITSGGCLFADSLSLRPFVPNTLLPQRPLAPTTMG